MSMKNIFLIVLIILIAIFNCYTLFILANPRVSEEYKAHYIDRLMQDWRPIRYHADLLSDGFDFSRPGIPDFIFGISGFSRQEDWGRWTVANHAKTAQVILKDPLAGNICIVLEGFVTPKQKSKSISFRFGDESKEVVWDPRAGALLLNFKVTRPARVFAITPSRPGMPREWGKVKWDNRKIAVGVKKLRFLNRACPSP